MGLPVILVCPERLEPRGTRDQRVTLAQLAFPDPEVSRVTKANGVSPERPDRRVNEEWRA